MRGSLPRTADAVSSLWIHQGDVLRAYAEEHQDTSDLALELPTGTGKTMPGLLIAEWVRRKSEGPVLYAAPTRQLADQVLTTSKNEGVPARLMVGSHRAWKPTDETDVEGGEAIAITTYSSIFNSHPKLPEPRLIVLDDAHAGEQFVGEQYGITIRRHEAEAAYLTVLNVLRPFLSGLQIQRLQGAPDPGAHHQVRLILPAVDPGALAQLDTALAGLGDSFRFQLAMIRAGLASCCVYLSYGGVQIRPMIPPTFENRVFSRAGQRVYLSATLGVESSRVVYEQSGLLLLPWPRLGQVQGDPTSGGRDPGLDVDQLAAHGRGGRFREVGCCGEVGCGAGEVEWDDREHNQALLAASFPQGSCANAEALRLGCASSSAGPDPPSPCTGEGSLHPCPRDVTPQPADPASGLC